MRSATQRWWLGIIVASALIAVLVELRAQTAPSESALVLEADQALGAALRADDKSVARRLLSLQFTYVDANGKIQTQGFPRRSENRGCCRAERSGGKDLRPHRHGHRLSQI